LQALQHVGARAGERLALQLLDLRGERRAPHGQLLGDALPGEDLLLERLAGGDHPRLRGAQLHGGGRRHEPEHDRDGDETDRAGPAARRRSPGGAARGRVGVPGVERAEHDLVEQRHGRVDRCPAHARSLLGSLRGHGASSVAGPGSSPRRDAARSLITRARVCSTYCAPASQYRPTPHHVNAHAVTAATSPTQPGISASSSSGNAYSSANVPALPAKLTGSGPYPWWARSGMRPASSTSRATMTTTSHTGTTSRHARPRRVTRMKRRSAAGSSA